MNQTKMSVVPCGPCHPSIMDAKAIYPTKMDNRLIGKLWIKALIFLKRKPVNYGVGNKKKMDAAI